VKCVDWITDSLAVSGSSDATLRIFSPEDGATRRVLTGHTSRLWDVATSPSAALIASGSGDGTVRIWSTGVGSGAGVAGVAGAACTAVLAGDGGDVYGVGWQPGGDGWVASACYDKIIRLWNVETGKLVRTFSGHAQSSLAVAYDPTGRVLASG
jgi:WD40 repeat protein